MPKTGSKSGNQAGAKQPPKSHKTTTGNKKSVKKPAAKTKTPVRKVTKQPPVTDEMIERYFLKLSHKKFVQLTHDWNEERLTFKLQSQPSYDAWLNYFKSMPVRKVKLLAETGLDILPTEGYAALARWHDIISNPGRIDKIHKAGLTTGKTSKTIVDFAKTNDRLGVLESIRDNLAKKLDDGTGARDAGQLSGQMMEVMTQIELYKKRLGPKQETTLGTLLADMPTGKRPSQNGSGTRHTRFASKVTIDDLEGESE